MKFKNVCEPTYAYNGGGLNEGSGQVRRCFWHRWLNLEENAPIWHRDNLWGQELFGG